MIQPEKSHHWKHGRHVLLLFITVLLGVGCTSRSVSNTPRTAIEQLLLSAAVDRMMEKLDLPELSGKQVYTDYSNLKAYDAEYVKVALRARMAQIGAILADDPKAAEYIVEVASGAMGNEYKSSMVGIPPLPVPNSPLPTPEAAWFRKTEQTAIVKLLIFVHSEGKFVALDHYYAKADRDEHFVLWYRFQRQDDIREGWEKSELKREDAVITQIATP